ncbi:MAG TPA: hypothetical protein VK705_04360 [Ferruginibacter sp.]|jgi:hypothetical protein|nr:hypothetical protein [Ferruginibacter sp.]
MYNEFKRNIVDTEIKDSLSRLEEAYINSFEYQCINSRKDWIVIAAGSIWLAAIVLLFIAL